MNRLLVMLPLVVTMTASADYQYILDPGVRPERPTAVVSAETVAAADIVRATSGASAAGGASWLHARWCEFTDYLKVRRDEFCGFIFSLR